MNLSIEVLPVGVVVESLIPVYKKMMDWRNNPEVMAGLYSQKDGHKITWDEHLIWCQSRNRDWRTFIIEYNGIKVGVVTIGQLDYWEPETGIYIGESMYWGMGIGREALLMVLEYIKNYGRVYSRTTILDTNLRSIHLYASLGFIKVGPARPGESLYRKEL